MRALLAVLLLIPRLALADATSYAEAEAGGFTIDESDTFGALLASGGAAILPIDNSTWKDVVNDVTATIRGGATIGQEGATGDIVAGARFTDFDGSDDVIDMGRSYTRGASPLVANLASASGPSSVFILIDRNTGVSTLVAEAEGTDRTFQAFISGSVTANYVIGGDTRPITDDLSTGVQSLATSHVSASSFRGFLNGTLDFSTDPSGTPSSSEINLSIGARWAGHPSTGSNYSDKAYIVYLFPDALTDQQQADLHTNPWRPFNATAPSSGLPPGVLIQLLHGQ